MVSSDGEDSDEELIDSTSPQVLRPLGVLKKITKMRRRMSEGSWIYKELKKVEGKIERQLDSHLEHGPAVHMPVPAPRLNQGAQAVLPPLDAPGSSRKGNGGSGSLAAAKGSPRAPRHPSHSSKRYVWKADEEETLKGLLEAASTKNKKVNWKSVSRKLRIPIDKCKRKAKSSFGIGSQRIGSEEKEKEEAPRIPAPLPTVSRHPQPPPTATVSVGQKRSRSRNHDEDTPLKCQINRVLQEAGGEGTADEVVEELMIEPRWANHEAGRAGLRRRVGTILSNSNGGMFESTTQHRGFSHPRVMYRQVR